MSTHTQKVLSITTVPSISMPPGRANDEPLEITLFGRYMRSCKNEFPCSLRKISVTGAEIASPHAVATGEFIVAYFDTLGGLEGKAVKTLDDGFAIEFSITQRRRQKLASQLCLLSKQDRIHSAAMARSSQKRIQLADLSIRVRFEDGRIENCDALDVSISSALLESVNRPPVGSLLTVGKLRARVMHHHGKGFGVAFIDTQKAAAVRRHFR